VPYHAAFFSEGSISIVLDYMDGGSLSDVTRAIGCIPETQLAGFAAQIVSGLRYLHANLRIVHRDVKPSNLLVNKAGRVKISDFGVSGQLANSVTKCNSWVGTVTYMSPERISGGKYGFDSDVWSFGLSLLECAVGRFPYPPSKPGEWVVGVKDKGGGSMGFWDLLDHIVEEDPPSLGVGDLFSKDFADFVGKCLVKEPGDRASAGDLLTSKWLEGVEEGSESALAELVTRACDKRDEEKAKASAKGA
jgi:serine/threonine protein kinase